MYIKMILIKINSNNNFINTFFDIFSWLLLPESILNSIAYLVYSFSLKGHFQKMRRLSLLLFVL